MNLKSLSKFTVAAVSCVLMAACAGNDEPGNEVIPTGKDSGFAMLTLNLPTQSGSRAVTNDQGDAQEYAVANGRAIIFQKGATEADAVFVCMSELSGMEWGAAQTGEVTTTGKAVCQVSDINLTDAAAQYAAIVVLNYNNSFVWPTQGQKFGDWSKSVISDMTLVKDNKTYLTMTSAAKYVAGAQPSILVDLDKARVCQTEAEAASAATAACDVFVQRNVAKVSLVTDANFNGNVSSSAYNGDKVAINAWTLDVTNKSTYPVQYTAGLKTSFSNIWDGGNSLNRFFGNGTRFQRVYWAEDPNYNKDITNQAEIEASFNIAIAVTGMPQYLYALENTFDINHQMQGQTTRALIKAAYTPSGMAAGETFFKIGAASTLWSAANLKAEIQAKAQAVKNATGVTVDLGSNFGAAGYHSLAEVTISLNGTKLSDSEYDAVAQNLGLASRADKSIATYANGQSFYVVRIKHFGDEDTPWTIGNPTYGGDNAKYLGRYGMVRNNWYEVNVRSISGPGAPEIPVIDPTLPDDENNYFIAVSINVLPWAKRVQYADL